MATKPPSHKKTLLGDREGRLAEFVEEVSSKMGSDGVDFLVKNLKDPNPYVRNSAWKAYYAMLKDVDKYGKKADLSMLTNEEVVNDVRQKVANYLSNLKPEEFNDVIQHVYKNRAAIERRDAQARLASENAARPLGEPAAI
jgi:HEAT repeat protein